MYCGPERVEALQQLFDTLCMIIQLRVKSSAMLELEPLRDRIARSIMQCAEAKMSDEEIFRTILEALGFTSVRMTLPVNQQYRQRFTAFDNQSSQQ